jgi:cytochrome c biogenesis protein CcdA
VLGAITTVAVNANMDVISGQYGGLAPLLSSALLLVIFALGLGLPLIIVSAFFGRADRNSLFWRILRGKGWEVDLLGRSFFLHSTSIVSGVLFIVLGVLMVAGRLALLDNLAPENLALDIAEVIAGIEDWLLSRLGG